MDVFSAIGYAQTAAEISAGITPTNYLYPELYFERYGGGVSATAAQNNAAMTAALEVVGSSGDRGGGILYFLSGGTYSFSNTTAFSLPTGLIIQGAGQYTTILSWSGTSTAIFLQVGSGGRNEIRDIQLLGPGGGTATTPSSNLGIGLQLGSSTADPGEVMMRRVRVTGFATGLSISGLLWGRFEMCEFGQLTSAAGTYSNNVGISFNLRAAGGAAVNVVTFSDCTIASNANAGVQGTGSSTQPYMNIIRWRACTIQNNCYSAPAGAPQFFMGNVQGFEILGASVIYTYGGTAPVAIQSDYMVQGLIADFYIAGCNYGIHDPVGSTMNFVDIIDGSISNVTTAAISAASEQNVVVRNVNVSSASVALSGTGCTYLPLGSGLASWPVKINTFTPTLSATSGSPTYTTQTGGFSKTGNVVNFNLSIVTSALGSLSGPIEVNGLPYVLENDHTIGAVFPVECIGITPAGSNNQFYGELAAGATSIKIWGGGTVAPVQVQGSALAAATTINITGSYQALS